MSWMTVPRFQLTVDQNDFLMHAILALSARHLQERYDDSSGYDYKLLEGNHLQNALTSFRSAVNANVMSSQDAFLATSFLLFFHACADAATSADPPRPCEDNSFIYLRGLRSIVVDNSHAAHSGRFRSLVAEPHLLPLVLQPAVPRQGPGAVFVGLLSSLPLQSPFAQNRELYMERIESLTPYFFLPEARSDDTEILDELLMSCLRWQVFCSAEYVALVQGHDIIALVILAHYYAVVGSLLAGAEDKWWWLRRKPMNMVRDIARYVGRNWASWMEWPQMIARRCEEGG
jgi:hypothetical protein